MHFYKNYLLMGKYTPKIAYAIVIKKNYSLKFEQFCIIELLLRDNHNVCCVSVLIVEFL